MRGSCRLLFLALAITWCMGCAAKKDKDNSQAPVATARASVDAGKAVYASCKPCHGDAAQGNAQMQSPALANLDPSYLQLQLANFQKGIRGTHPDDTYGAQMAAIAATLTDTVAIADVAAYINSLPDVSITYSITGDARKGERTYQSICGSCHGPQGKGNEALHAPRLNGLEDWYIKRQLVHFQNGLRGTHAGDQYGAQMVSMATMLKDEQAINDVIAYLQASTKPATP